MIDRTHLQQNTSTLGDEYRRMEGDFNAATELRITVLVTRSLSLFESLTLALEDDHIQASQARLYLSRFKLWVGNLGAHHGSGLRSLEYKLRDASHIRKLVISLLSDLCRSIERGVHLVNQEQDPDTAGDSYDEVENDLADYFNNDQDSDKSEGARTLDEIAHVISCLLRLSPTISNPPHYSQFLARDTDSLFESYVQWDTQHVRERFADVSENLSDRLGRAMARRRLYFEYQKACGSRLAQGLVEGEIENKQATMVASSVPKHLKEADEARSSPVGLADGGGSPASSPSHATSKHDSPWLRVSSIPDEHKGRPFKCPFCHMVVSIDTGHAWKKHVFGDLRPYVCLSDICKTSEHLYMQRGEWVMHMKREHWKSWQCPFGCNMEFDKAEHFQQHVEVSHKHDISPDNIDALGDLSCFSNAAKAKGQCPLCFGFNVSSEEQYEKHIGQHLEDLALFTLPDTGYEGNSDNVDNRTDAGDEKGNDEVQDEDNGNISRTNKLEAEVLAAWIQREKDLEGLSEAEEARKTFEQRLGASKSVAREAKTNLEPGEDDVDMDDFKVAPLATASVEPASSDPKAKRPRGRLVRFSLATSLSAPQVTRSRSKTDKASQESMDSQREAEHKTKENELQGKHAQDLHVEEAIEQAKLGSEANMKAVEDWREAEGSTRSQVEEVDRRDFEAAVNIVQGKTESEVRDTTNMSSSASGDSGGGRSMESQVGRSKQRYNTKGERLVAGIVPLTSDQNYVLLIQSTRRKGWVLPKGGWESDETCQEAAEREAWEEAGITVQISYDLGDINEKRAPKSTKDRSRYHFFEGVGSIIDKTGASRSLAEVYCESPITNGTEPHESAERKALEGESAGEDLWRNCTTEWREAAELKAADKCSKKDHKELEISETSNYSTY